MSRLKIISPKEDLVEAVAHHLQPHGNDFSSSVVVFPGKRPAHFLRKLLAERAGTSIIPPSIFSIDHFVEFLLQDHLGIRRKVVGTVDAIAILHDVHLRLNSKLGGTSYTSLDAFLPLAIKLNGELEEVVMAEVPQRRLQEVALGIKYTKFHPLSDYYDQFYREIEQRDCLTRSTMYRMVADGMDAIDFGGFDKVLLAGFYAFTNVEKRIVSHLHKLENAIFLFQNGLGLRKQLEDLGIEPDDSAFPETVSPDTAPSIHFYRAPDKHGQILALAATFEEKIRSGTLLDERSVVVLPSAEALFPVLHAPLSLLNEEEYNISLGYPLVRTPVFGFLNSLMELVSGSFNGKYSAHSYLRFVLHPYTKNIRLGARSDVTRILFHRIEEFLARHKAKLLLTLNELEGDEALHDFIFKAFEGLGDAPTRDDLKRHVKTIHDQTIGRFLSFSSLGDFSQRGIDVLTFVFDHSTASLHPYFRPYAHQFIDVLDGVRSSLLSKKRFDTVAGYFAFFRQYVATQSVPFSGTPVRGLQVLGLLETRNLKFDTLYMLDANDDIVPSKPSEDLLLPQPVRQMLGLETNRDRERLSRYHFNLAVESSREVHLFYTETESGKKEKSRFVQKLIWNEERKVRRPLEKELEQTIKYGVSLANQRPQSIMKTQQMVDFLRKWNRFSSTQLDAYLACPLRFYYRTVLGLREKAEASEDVDQLDIGSLVHDILHEYFSSFAGQTLRPEDLKAENLEAVINRRFTEEYGTDLVGPALFLRQQVSLQLRKFLEGYQKVRARSDQIVIMGLEQEFTVEKGAFRCTGSIDRIETRNGRPFILDYKTGKDDAYVKIQPATLDLANPNSWREGIGSFQLPMYMLLYAEANRQPIDAITPAYLFLGRNEIDTEIEIGLGGGEYGPAMVYHAVEPVMFKLIEEILNPNAPFAPTEHFEEECPQCPYSALCGTRWAQGSARYM